MLIRFRSSFDLFIIIFHVTIILDILSSSTKLIQCCDLNIWYFLSGDNGGRAVDRPVWGSSSWLQFSVWQCQWVFLHSPEHRWEAFKLPALWWLFPNLCTGKTPCSDPVNHFSNSSLFYDSEHMGSGGNRVLVLQ